MDFKQKVSREIAVPAVVFLLVLIAVSLFFFHIHNSVVDIIDEAEPTHDAMQHMILDVYQDNIVLLEYLNTADYVSATSLDKVVEQSNARCHEVENNIENLIVSKQISDEEIITEYESAYFAHEKVEAVRDELIALHKEELATGVDLSSQKSELLETHSSLLAAAIDAFSLTADKIESRNDLLKERIFFQTKLYFLFVILLLITFIIVVIVKVRKLSLTIIEPLDDTMHATERFVGGKYDARIQPTGVKEISDLQENINRVFDVVKSASEDGRKDTIDTQLLKKEYLAVLDVIKENMVKKKKTNISDVKKQLHITHPTALERVRYLEKRGFISVQKEGREKFLVLLTVF